MMKLRALLALALGAMSTIPAGAQLASPNGAGVAMGHLHLFVRDVDANRRFLIVLGGRAVESHGMHLIQFPGVDVLLDKGEPTGGTVGTAVNHIGFQVRSMPESLERWQGAGLKIEPGNRPSQVYLTMPDEVRIEILEDPALKTPLAFHHVHFYVSDIAAMQAWYAKNFGAIPGKRGQFDAADVPGVNLTFQKAETAQTPTQGAALDHIGFEVKNLEAFTKKLAAAGVKFDRPYRKSPESNVASAFLTDPSGTTIELTEGLTAAN
jgi:catechol 2,3-dioxygenase-like lactoylglutathione lyase family enzyme